jgi:hypothetical protein
MAKLGAAGAATGCPHHIAHISATTMPVTLILVFIAVSLLVVLFV